MRLTLINDQNYETLTQKRLLVKEVFDDTIFNPANPVPTLKKMIDNADVSDWRRHFISNSDPFSYCKQGFIHKNGEEILLFHASQMNHLHIELNTYLLVKKCTGKVFGLFSGLSEKSAKGGGERSYAFIKKEADDLQILVWYKDAKYEVGFNNYSKDPEIEKVLAENKMEAVDTGEYGDNAFMRPFDTDEETIKFMEKLSRHC
jgi:hypothetical protein